MVLTGNNQDAVVNAAYDLRAHFVIKPVTTERIEHFLSDAASFDWRLERGLEEWVRRYALSEALADVLRRAALGESHSTIAAGRGTSEQTVKKQAKTLLAKTGDDSLHAVAERLLRELARA